MGQEIIVIVYDKDGEEIMSYYKNSSDAIKAITAIGAGEGDPRRVVRIFSVNNLGEVVFKNLIFNGRLELQDGEASE